MATESTARGEAERVPETGMEQAIPLSGMAESE